MKKSRLLLHALFLPVKYAAYALSKVTYRSPNVWAFGSWKGYRYADNTKWFFEYCNGARKTSGMRYVWLSRDENIIREVRQCGHTAHHVLSLAGWYYAAIAGVHVFDSYTRDTNHWLSGNAVKVNLWHGIPLKKIERDIRNKGNLFNYYHHGPILLRMLLQIAFPWWNVRYNLVAASSDYVQSLLSQAFAVPAENVRITGYPRNDILFRQGATKVDYAGSIRIMYLPTFRDKAAKGEGLPLDLREIDAFLKEQNAHLDLKLHPNDQGVLNAEGCKHIRVLEKSADTYKELSEVDILVTDYSSVYFDFMLLRRPIIFFCFDPDTYLARDREMYDDYFSVTPGRKVFSSSELIDALRESICTLREGRSALSDNYDDIARRYHLHFDDGSRHRLWQEIRRAQGRV